jgi:hypothetical protein
MPMFPIIIFLLITCKFLTFLSILFLKSTSSSGRLCLLTLIRSGALPQTRHLKGSNNCFINVVQDRVPGRAIIISAIDNLVKGASGQAIQNMNIMLGKSIIKTLSIKSLCAINFGCV